MVTADYGMSDFNGAEVAALTAPVVKVTAEQVAGVMIVIVDTDGAVRVAGAQTMPPGYTGRIVTAVLSSMLTHGVI